MRHNHHHPQTRLPGPHEGALAPILCEASTHKEPLLLDTTYLTTSGLTFGHQAILLATGCLEETCLAQREAASARRPGGISPTRAARAVLLLSADWRALLPSYDCHLDDSSAEEIRIAKLALALRRMAERPLWKREAGELWWQGILVKRFRNDAADQRCVLNEFQAHGWSDCKRNPLPHSPRINCKERLHNTIRDLNRGQHPQRIWFRGDGSGGIRWEALI